MEPLSQAELLEVLTGLEEAVAANPALARTPLFVGTMRLALSARASHVDPEVPRLAALLDAARARVEEEQAAKRLALGRVEAANRTLEVERVQVAAALKKSLVDASTRADALQAEVTRLAAALTTQDASRPEAAAVHADVLAIVRSYEWASKIKVAHKGSTRDVPGCPGCAGLRPDGLPKGIQNVGHRDTCWYNYIIGKIVEKAP